MKTLSYTFENVPFCNMCGRDTSLNKILGQRMNKSQGLRPKMRIGITTSVIKCKNCALIYSNPLPIPGDVSDHYGVPAESYFQENYFVEDPEYFQTTIEKVKQLLNFEQGMKALDIGSGIGKCIRALERAGFDSYGVEPSATFRNFAIQKTGIPESKIELGMIENVEFPDAYFDFITFGAVLEHLYDPSECINKAFRWLKPHGILYVEVPSSDYLIARIFNLYFKFIGTNYVSSISPMHAPFHLYEFSLRSFQEHAKKHNYRIAFHKYFVCPIHHVPKVFHRLLEWYMERTNSGLEIALWLSKPERLA